MSADLLNAPNGFEAARQLFAYILANAREEEEMELHKRVAQLSQAAENAFVTAAEALHRRGLLEGREEGLAGQREMLLAQLTERFGFVPTEVQNRLAAANSAQLIQWSKNFVTAATLDAVFGE